MFRNIDLLCYVNLDILESTKMSKYCVDLDNQGFIPIKGSQSLRLTSNSAVRAMKKKKKVSY